MTRRYKPKPGLSAAAFMAGFYSGGRGDSLPCEYCRGPSTHTVGEGPFRLNVCECAECKQRAFEEVCSRGEQP